MDSPRTKGVAALYPTRTPLDIPSELIEELNRIGPHGEVWTFVAKMMEEEWAFVAGLRGEGEAWAFREELCAAVDVLQRSRPKVILVCPYDHLEHRLSRYCFHRRYSELRPKTFLMDLSFPRSFIRSFVRSFVRSLARSHVYELYLSTHSLAM